MSSAWTSVALTVLTFVIGGAIQIGVLGFFFGKMRGTQEAISAQLASVVQKLSTFDGVLGGVVVHRAEIDQRMSVVEKNTQRLEEMDRLVRDHLAVYREHKAEADKFAGHVGRKMDGYDRALARVMEGRVQGAGSFQVLPPSDG